MRRRIVEFEQAGEKRADYGAAPLKRLSTDLTKRFGRGLSERNLQYMRLFYEHWPISQSLSAKSEESCLANLRDCFMQNAATAGATPVCMVTTGPDRRGSNSLPARPSGDRPPWSRNQI